jgi:molybdopterin/thiamine biosynthesis adenylyltransferase
LFDTIFKFLYNFIEGERIEGVVMSLKRQDRYKRNGLTIDERDQQLLKQSTVCVLGCGGLGGYTIEMLARAGIGTLIVIDKDTYDETNLNRQLLSSMNNLGQSKAKVAEERVHQINDEIHVIAMEVSIDEHNGAAILQGCDLVVDALDSIPTRKLIAAICRDLDKPFIYGAIAGWYGQVSTIMPDEHTLDFIYQKDTQSGDELRLGNPSFTPALVAAIQVSETIKVLLSKGELLTGGFMHIDLLTNEMDKISFH